LHLHHDTACIDALLGTAARTASRIPDEGGVRAARPAPVPAPASAPTGPAATTGSKLPDAPKAGKANSGKAQVDVVDVTNPNKPKDLGDAGHAVRHLKGATKDAVENADAAAKLLRENDPTSKVSHMVAIHVPHEVASSPAASMPPGVDSAAMLIVPDQNIIKTFQMEANWKGADIPKAWRDAKTTDALLPEDAALHETAHLNQEKYMSMPDAGSIPLPGGGSSGGASAQSGGGGAASTGPATTGTAGPSASYSHLVADALIGRKAGKSTAAESGLAEALGGKGRIVSKVGDSGGPGATPTDAGSTGTPPPASSDPTSTASLQAPSIADDIERTAVAEGMADAVAMAHTHDWRVGEAYFAGEKSAVRDVSKDRKQAGDVGAFTNFQTIDSGLGEIRTAESDRTAFMDQIRSMTPEQQRALSKDDIAKLEHQAAQIDAKMNDGRAKVGGDDGHQAGTIVSRTFYELQKQAGWNATERLSRAVGDDSQLWSGTVDFDAAARAMQRNADEIDPSGKLRTQVDAALEATHLADAIPAPPTGGFGRRHMME
jgi:hypothetical protein